MKTKSETNNEMLSFPFYAKASFIVIGLFVFLYMLYIAQEIFVPLVFSGMIAIMLHPLVEFFNRRKIPRILSISLALFLAIAGVSGIIILVFSQASLFLESWPKILESFGTMMNQSVQWLANLLHVSPRVVLGWIDKGQKELLDFSTSGLGKTLLTLGNALIAIFLIPVYVFLILYYQPLLMNFIRNLFGAENREKVSVIADETKLVIQQYLIGLLIEFIIIAFLNTVGLWILGIQYAILLGVIGSLLNIIPYVGGIIAVFLYMMVSLVTIWPPSYSLLVFALYAIIQFIDNNIIVPKIVASKVQINALISIVIVIAGGMYWGISGMFLSLPVIAVVKLIFDRIDVLRPWGYFLGNSMEYSSSPKSFSKRPGRKPKSTSNLPQ